MSSDDDDDGYEEMLDYLKELEQEAELASKDEDSTSYMSNSPMQDQRTARNPHRGNRGTEILTVGERIICNDKSMRVHKAYTYGADWSPGRMWHMNASRTIRSIPPVVCTCISNSEVGRATTVLHVDTIVDNGFEWDEVLSRFVESRRDTGNNRLEDSSLSDNTVKLDKEKEQPRSSSEYR